MESKHKIIKFYNCLPQPSIGNAGIGNKKTSIDLLKSVFPEAASYSFMYDKQEYTIDILDIGETYIFGTCAKRNDITPANFYQTRDKEHNSTTPYSSIDPKKQLEVYTYFYIDCSKDKMAAILQKSIANVHILLTEYIVQKSQNTLNFYISPILIRDLKQAVKKLNKSKTLSISYLKNESKDNIRQLTETLGGTFDFDTFSIKIKLSSGNEDSVIDKFVDYFDKNRDTIRSMTMSGANEYGLKETINFMESYFTRNTPLSLTDNYATNTDYIKEKLKDALNDL